MADESAAQQPGATAQQHTLPQQEPPTRQRCHGSGAAQLAGCIGAPLAGQAARGQRALHAPRRLHLLQRRQLAPGGGRAAGAAPACKWRLQQVEAPQQAAAMQVGNAMHRADRDLSCKHPLLAACSGHLCCAKREKGTVKPSGRRRCRAATLCRTAGGSGAAGRFRRRQPARRLQRLAAAMAGNQASVLLPPHWTASPGHLRRNPHLAQPVQAHGHAGAVGGQELCRLVGLPRPQLRPHLRRTQARGVGSKGPVERRSVADSWACSPGVLPCMQADPAPLRGAAQHGTARHSSEARSTAAGQSTAARLTAWHRDEAYSAAAEAQHGAAHVVGSTKAGAGPSLTTRWLRSSRQSA